ncbi:MAG: flagellar assembly protein FliW [Bryobacteraceae bacterium]
MDGSAHPQGAGEVRRTSYHFPRGIPAFENVTRFELIENPVYAPLVVLEAPEGPPLRFACAPVELIAPDYQLELSEEETALLGGGEAPLRLLAILTFREGAPPTANLLAPVVLNPATRVGVQSVQASLRYSHVHPVREASPCS